MSNVFIPASIRDPALRRTLEQICLELNTGGGGNSEVTVQDASPTDSTPGETGDIIYATGTDSIWVFEGTSWEQATSGVSGYTMAVESFVLDALQADPTMWVKASPNIKNDTDTVIALVPRVFLGGVEWLPSEYEDDGVTYRWVKSGSNSTFSANSSIQDNDYPTGATSRVLVINQDDITDGGSDAYFCEVTF